MTRARVPRADVVNLEDIVINSEKRLRGELIKAANSATLKLDRRS